MRVMMDGSATNDPTVDTGDEHEAGAARNPYGPPQLVRLETLAEMTRQVGYRGQPDGGRFPQRFRTGTF
jgi:hypothetical protein